MRLLWMQQFQLPFRFKPMLIANANMGAGATSAFTAKIGLNPAKNEVFCVLYRPMGGL